MWAVFVLLWKHTMMRKRSCSAMCEYFVPLLLIIMLYLLPKNDTKRNSEPLTYEELLHRYDGSVLFTPETDFTNRLMDIVGAKLSLNRLDHLPSDAEEVGYYPFSNETSWDMMRFTRDIMTSEDALVIFEDIEPDIWPKKLNYTIRMKTDFMTHQPGPYDADKYDSINVFNLGFRKNYASEQDEAFMRLQWTIDTSYLELMTGAEVEQTLSLQELPFTDEPNPLVVCLVASTMVPLAIAMPIGNLAARLFEEKNSGLYELQKVAGVSGETIALSHCLDMVPVMLVYVVGYVLFFKLGGYIPHTGACYIVLAMALYFYTIVALTFVLLYLFDISSAQTVQLVIFGIIFALVILCMFTRKVESRALFLLCSLIPIQPIASFFVSLGVKEAAGTGITMSNMWSLDQFPKIKVGECYIFMVIQIFLFSIISWYLARVRPGKFGQALPWKFPFKKEYWSNKPQETAPMEDQFVNPDDEQYFEKPPNDVPVGIQVNNVYKSFGSDQILHGVNLAMYRGEITVLLGHNGAGKTTLINIITGLIPASSGHVLVEGKDTVMQSKEVRKLIGLCPQQNMFFEYLSVIEHVRFFSMLKGQSCSQARINAKNLLARLQLSDKAQYIPSALSGGMKRRVQLACAVAGGSRVLVLDEPTSGLDVETRRELSDLLLSLRGERTVLLTTHFMEEADALGDRIAALHHGRVRCNATSMFLKRAIGTGYRLTFTTTRAPKEELITDTIASVVPDAEVRDRRPNGLTYNLPAKDTAHFPALFSALEDERSRLEIETIGVGKSTLDEVFLELCSDEKPTYVDDGTKAIEPVQSKVTGPRLCARQFAVLLLRQWHYVKPLSLITLIIALGALICFMSFAYNNPREQKVQSEENKALNLELFDETPKRRALVNVDEEALWTLRAGFRNVKFEEVPNVTHAVLRTRRTDIKEYKKYLVGIEINDTDAKALYSPSAPHTAPVSLNTLSNALAVRLLGGDSRSNPLRGSEAQTFTVRNRPLQGALVPYDEAKLRLPKSNSMIQAWAFYMAITICFYISSFSRLPCLEHATGTRHSYIMAGAPRALHWAALLVGHGLQVLLIELLVVLFAGAMDRDGTFNRPGFLGALFMVLLLGGVANLEMVYFVSTLLSHTATNTTIGIIIMVCTFLTLSIPESEGAHYKLMYISYVLLPPHTLTMGILKAAMVAQVNGHCSLNKAMCPIMTGPGMFKAEKCCGSTVSEPWSYFAIDNAAGFPMIILFGQGIAYFVLTYLSDDGALHRMLAKMSRFKPPTLRFDDAAVREEGVYVEKTIKLSDQLIPDAILCYKVRKNFPRCCKKMFCAVKSISFSVKKGECFGLLGVNGAGKSTTFRMLTGEIAPTGGEIYANGFRATQRSKYMPTFSYCPQFGGVDDFLTGRQNLNLVLTLRGLQASDVKAVAASWIEEVDLTRFADKRVSSYSGGSARRLAAAAALCQSAQTAVLDEPTAGVDPVARRHMHQALMRARRRHSIIVASHSLNEMEALCHRIAIMSGGELRALGSAPELKAQHAQGYSIVFKLATTDTKDDAVNKLNKELHAHFNCELKDQQRNMMRYHVKDSLPYSELFIRLEQLRDEFPSLVDDYTVTETTLEEVFLALAKEAKEQPITVTV